MSNHYVKFREALVGELTSILRAYKLSTGTREAESLRLHSYKLADAFQREIGAQSAEVTKLLQNAVEKAFERVENRFKHAEETLDLIPQAFAEHRERIQKLEARLDSLSSGTDSRTDSGSLSESGGSRDNSEYEI